KKERIYKSKLDLYKNIIDEKIENNNIPATGIYLLLKEKYSYDGKYGILRKYVSTKKKEIITNLTIRFETIKGYQSQVDWKEKVKLHDKNGNEYLISVFLIVLGYSRYKYIELTFDQTQPTLYKCLNNAFKYFNGTTEEILFDNMKTVVDHTKSTYTNTIINQSMEQFSKDAGFKIVTCRPYRPRTKGKVETLAKIMNRLKAFDYEFDDIKDLNNIVIKLNYILNYEEKSQATNEIPKILFEKEKEYLLPTNFNLLKTYYNSVKLYKVSTESMIKYEGRKYSVPIKYIGKNLIILEENTCIHIYYNTELICSYNKITHSKFNYKKSDYMEILKQSAFESKTEKEIESFIESNLKSMDSINIEE
ncbi:MAG: IS21 family transposase, partial [Clostridia bacterium]